MRTGIAVLFATGLLAAPAGAQMVSDPLSGDLFHVIQMEDRVLRIDRRNGDVSECEQGQSGWVCRLSADDRLAYEAEINRLDAEVERLSAELETARSAVPGEAQDDAPLTDLLPDVDLEATRERLNLPTDEELDAVMSTAEEVMRRFMGMVANIRDDVEAQRLQ